MKNKQIPCSDPYSEPPSEGMIIMRAKTEGKKDREERETERIGSDGGIQKDKQSENKGSQIAL